MADIQHSSFSIALLHPKYLRTWLLLSIAYPLSWLPIKVRHAIGKWIGINLYNRKIKRRAIVNTNLQLCFPELDIAQREENIKEHFLWYGRAIAEYSFFFFASHHRLQKHLIIEGQEHIEKALKQKKNVMVLLGHSVFLEFAPALIGEKYKAYASYKPLSNPVIDWMIARSRAKHMLFTITRKEGLVRLVRELKNEQLLIFLPDEDHGAKHSSFAPFFGVPKATLDNPTRIAKLANAARLPTMAFYDDALGKYKVIIGEAIDCGTKQPKEEHAAALNQRYEEMIKRYPMQYMWLLKLFKTLPNAEKRLY